MFPVIVELFGRFVNQLDPNLLWKEMGTIIFMWNAKKFFRFFWQFPKCVASQLDAQMADKICIISHLCQITVIIKILFEIANSRVFECLAYKCKTASFLSRILCTDLGNILINLNTYPLGAAKPIWVGSQYGPVQKRIDFTNLLFLKLHFFCHYPRTKRRLKRCKMRFWPLPNVYDVGLFWVNDCARSIIEGLKFQRPFETRIPTRKQSYQMLQFLKLTRLSKSAKINSYLIKMRKT